MLEVEEEAMLSFTELCIDTQLIRASCGKGEHGGRCWRVSRCGGRSLWKSFLVTAVFPMK